MNISWKNHTAWVAYFDILGFRQRIKHDAESLWLDILKSSIDEVVTELENKVDHFRDTIAYTFYADTFIIYSKTKEKNDYPALVRASKDFLCSCIFNKLPLSGAISYGDLIFGHDGKIVIGKAALESHEYVESQNWIGLILTPSASAQLKSISLDPIGHNFVQYAVPLRKHPIPGEDIYAYNFSNGKTSYECPLLPKLKEMLHEAPEGVRAKYMNTIRFIEKHYPRLANEALE